MNNIIYLVQVLIISSIGLSMPAFADASRISPSASHDIVIVDYRANDPSYFYRSKNKKNKHYYVIPPARYYRSAPRQHRKTYQYRYYYR